MDREQALEAALSQVERNFGKFYGKIEYRYSRYEEVDLNRDQVIAGIGYRF